MKRLLQNHKLMAVLCPVFSITTLILSFSLDEVIRELTRKNPIQQLVISALHSGLFCALFLVYQVISIS